MPVILYILTIIVFSNDDNQCLLIEPPNPVPKFFYRCDRKFHLDDLLNLYKQCDQHAIVLTSGKRTEFHVYSDNNRQLLCTIKDILPNQHNKGGQSAQRFGRIRDEKILVYINKIIDKMTKYYTTDGKFIYKSIIIAGPAEIKQMICSQKIFIKIYQQYLAKIITIPEITDQTIYNVIDIIKDLNDSHRNSIMEKITNMINDPITIDLMVFGTENVHQLYITGQLDKVYVFHDYNDKDAILNCISKTEKNIFYSKECKKLYGDLIGIRYFSEINYE